MVNQEDESNKLDRILDALRDLSNFACPPTSLPPQEVWPKTRHIANYCNLDIYTTRNYLMKLVNNNQAYVSSGTINNSLRWYIIEKNATSKS